jgi:hypothetical protein
MHTPTQKIKWVGLKFKTGMKGNEEGTDERESDRRGRFAATTEQCPEHYPSMVVKFVPVNVHGILKLLLTYPLLCGPLFA